MLEKFNSLLKIKKNKKKPLDKVDLFLTLSTVCNYHCVFCNREVKPEIIRVKDILKFDELIENANIVDITGYGEITIHPDFAEIIKKFSAKKVPIRFVTNGSKLNKEYAQLLIQSEINEIVFSLNSLNPITYEKIHGNSSKIETVLENIDYLLSLNPTFPVRLSFVMTAWNFMEIPNFIKYVKDRIGKIDTITCMGLTPTLNHIYSPDLIIKNTTENKEYLQSMRILAEKTGIKASILDLDNQTTSDSPVDPKRLKRIIKDCDWVYNKTFIEADGSVLPCCWSRVNLGNIKNSSFKEIWLGNSYENLRNEILKGNLKYCHNCRKNN